MLALRWDESIMGCQLAATEAGLTTDEGLETAVWISLFTDRRAGPEDAARIPKGASRRGWWADALRAPGAPPIGSRLWLLDFSRVTPETVRLAGEYAAEALAWLVTDGIAAQVSARAIRLRADAIGIETTITRPGDDQAEPFRRLWEVTAASLGG